VLSGLLQSLSANESAEMKMRKYNGTVMGAVMRGTQIAERLFEIDENCLLRITVTVAHKPPHEVDDAQERALEQEEALSDS